MLPIMKFTYFLINYNFVLNIIYITSQENVSTKGVKIQTKIKKTNSSLEYFRKLFGHMWRVRFQVS